jgi:hypothetical protein
MSEAFLFAGGRERERLKVDFGLPGDTADTKP